MKHVGWMGFVLLVIACEKQSKLDSTLAIDQAGGGGDVETRLRRIEAKLDKYGEALDFLAKVYEQQKAQQDAEARAEHAPDAVFGVAVADDVKAGLVDGPATAPVTIVKAFDFACPYCMRVNDTMHELVADYRGKVRVVFKNLVVHPDTAMPAHLASCAAAKQGKYVAFKDAFWEKGFKPYMDSQGRNRDSLGKDNILVIAKGVGLDAAKLATDMDGAECKALVRSDMTELEKFQVNATPAFFINGQFVGGAMPKESFKEIIDAKLKIAEASGVAGAEYYEREIVGKGEKKFRSKMDPKPN
jgi:protein-disulfide isomerase